MDGSGRLVDRRGYGPRALEVWESGGRRWLQHANGVLQGAVDTADPDHLVLAYSHAMACSLLLLERAPARALMLGLGAGVLACFLRRHFPLCRVTVVENDPDCIEIAREHFGLPDADERLCLLRGDAREVLPGVGTRADLVLVDLFDADGMPAWLAAEALYRECRRCLDAGAVLAANLWLDEGDETLAPVRAIERALGRSCLLLPVAGTRNVVALATNGPAPRPDGPTLRRRVRALVDDHGVAAGVLAGGLDALFAGDVG